MTETKAKEFVEGGMRLSIAAGEKISELIGAARESGEINEAEEHRMVECLTRFEGVALRVAVEGLSSRGPIMASIEDFVSHMDESLRANPSVAIESILELTLPGVIEGIARRNIPAEISHVMKVVGWNRPMWNVERMEAGIISRAREIIRAQRKGK